jgi:hypothetical protein
LVINKANQSIIMFIIELEIREPAKRAAPTSTLLTIVTIAAIFREPKLLCVTT